MGTPSHPKAGSKALCLPLDHFAGWRLVVDGCNPECARVRTHGMRQIARMNRGMTLGQALTRLRCNGCRRAANAATPPLDFNKGMKTHFASLAPLADQTFSWVMAGGRTTSTAASVSAYPPAPRTSTWASATPAMATTGRQAAMATTRASTKLLLISARPPAHYPNCLCAESEMCRARAPMNDGGSGGPARSAHLSLASCLVCEALLPQVAAQSDWICSSDLPFVSGTR